MADGHRRPLEQTLAVRNQRIANQHVTQCTRPYTSRYSTPGLPANGKKTAAVRHTEGEEKEKEKVQKAAAALARLPFRVLNENNVVTGRRPAQHGDTRD